MIDRARRDQLADAIHGLLWGQYTNDEFDDWLFGSGFNPYAEPSEYEDRLVGPVVERVWCLYSSATLWPYRLTGPHRLPQSLRRDVLRWILFLRSDLAYEWPVMHIVNRDLLPAGCLVSLFTLGLASGSASLPPQVERQKQMFEAAGDVEVWPFIRTADFARCHREVCPIAALQFAG